MDLPIRNISDLRGEISRLKSAEREQNIALGLRFKNPSALFSTVLTLFPKELNPDGSKKQGFFDQDMFGMLSRLILPLTLNKTIFKNSNFIIKTLVGLVSQKASHFITEDSVTGVWDKAKLLFTKFTKNKHKHEETTHHDIPPYSETY